MYGKYCKAVFLHTQKASENVRELVATTRRLTGSRIREKRLDLGIRQATLAEDVGISPSYLNLIEHNRRRIGGKLLGDLARALGVEVALLTEGADSDLLDQMRSAAGLAGELADVARAEELAARFPGWAALIAAQARRISTLDTHLRSLRDRLTHDPHLATSLHEVISAVTAIRSTASILVGQEKLDADWQRRFHENIHADSLRLAQNSEALIAYLEMPGDDSAGVPLTPLEQVETYLARTGFHIAALEGGRGDIDAVVAGSGLTGPAAQLLAIHCRQYKEDAKALPLADFTAACQQTKYDPARLAQGSGSGLARVLRRMAALPSDAGHPPMGLTIADASGALRLIKPVPGFAMPRGGGGCPLWPVFGAFSRPSQPIRAEVALPGAVAQRLLCYAIAEPGPIDSFDATPILLATMLVLPDPPDTGLTPIPVGPTCRICPRAGCLARREPAMAGLAVMER